MDKNTDFITGSSKAAEGLDIFWNNTLAPLFAMMEPLVKSAEGLIKLLKLLP